MTAHKKITEEQKNQIAADLLKHKHYDKSYGWQVSLLNQRRLARVFGLHKSSIGRIWKNVRKNIDPPARARKVAAPVRKQGVDAPTPVVRSAHADVNPPDFVTFRTRSSIVVVFDVNTPISSVVASVVAAWEKARGGV